MTDNAVRTVTGVHLAVVLALLGGLAYAGMPPAALVNESWGWAFLVANLGVLGGNLTMVWLANQPDDAVRIAREGRREDLEDSRQIVVHQLRALELDKDKLAPEDFAREKAELLQIGAQASRELDEGEPTAADATVVQIMSIGGSGVPTSPATVPGPSAPILSADILTRRLQAERDGDPAAFDRALAAMGYHRGTVGGEWRGAFVTAVVAIVVLLLFVGAGGSSRERGAGDSMTGGDGIASPSASMPSSAPSPIEQRLAETPDDLDTLLEAQRMALQSRQQNLLMEYNERALAIAPEHPEVLTFRAILLRLIGDNAKALEILDGVIERTPEPMALLVRSQILVETEPCRAVADLERVESMQPSPMVEGMIAQARAAAPADAPCPPSAITPGSTARPPAAGAPPTAATAGREVFVSGSLDLAPGTDTSGYRNVFLSLRPAGGGPPLATKKLPIGTFPMAFQITPADRMRFGPMANMPVPESFQLKVWLDLDGDPLSQPDGQPIAEQATVAKGTTDLSLGLK